MLTSKINSSHLKLITMPVWKTIAWIWVLQREFVECALRELIQYAMIANKLLLLKHLIRYTQVSMNANNTVKTWILGTTLPSQPKAMVQMNSCGLTQLVFLGHSIKTLMVQLFSMSVRNAHTTIGITKMRLISWPQKCSLTIVVKSQEFAVHGMNYMLRFDTIAWYTF